MNIRCLIVSHFVAVSSLLVFGDRAGAQVSQEPVGARLEYQVALPGGPWQSSLNIKPGQPVEW